MSFKGKFDKFIEYLQKMEKSLTYQYSLSDESDSVLKPADRASPASIGKGKRIVLVQLFHKSNKSLQRKILLDCMLANKNWLSIEQKSVRRLRLDARYPKNIRSNRGC